MILSWLVIGDFELSMIIVVISFEIDVIGMIVCEFLLNSGLLEFWLMMYVMLECSVSVLGVLCRLNVWLIVGWCGWNVILCIVL